MQKISKVNIFVILFLLISVCFPIVQMLLMVNWNDFSSLISSNAFKEALSNSFFVTIISSIISLLLAYFLAYTLNRTNIKHKAVLKVLLTVPMLIPSISHGLGLINLFGTNGIISNAFNFDIVGPAGIIIGSIMYSFPVAFLMIDDGFNYIDNNMYNTASVLGLTKFQTFKTVTMCYLKKPILSALFVVFTMIFTDYGVPLSVGGKFITLPVFLYKEVIGLLDFSKGTMIGLFLLIPAVISFLFDNFSKNYSSGEFVGSEYKVKENKKRDIITTFILYLVIIFIFIVIGSFIYNAFINNPALDKSFSLKHFEYVFSNDIKNNIFNSLFVALIVSIVGTVISYVSAYATSRIKSAPSPLIHILTITTLAVPGIVLGLSYSIAFRDSFIYNTFIILILVNIIHFIASPYLMAYNALQKVNPNYEVVARTCKISQIRILLDVIIPCTKKTIREMFAYFFVNSMVTISAITFLFSTKTMPLSLLINVYESNLMLGEAAIISLIILTFNLIVKGTIYLINRHERMKFYEYNQ